MMETIAEAEPLLVSVPRTAKRLDIHEDTAAKWICC
jgi:hypothetical protein